MILKNNKRIDGVSLDTTPIGALFAFTGLIAPQGYLLCQGQLVSKTRYAELYAICGNTFGTATATEFYLPDLRGKTITGYKENDSTFGTLGALIGNLTHTHSYSHTHSVPGVAHTHSTGNHTLTIAEMPSHNHSTTFKFNGGANSAYSLDWTNGAWQGPYSEALGAFSMSNTGGGGAHNHGDTGSTTPSSTTTNSQSTSTSGSSSSLQPSLNLNWIIKAEVINYTSSQVYDGLDSTSSIDSLSAKQGKILNDRFSNYFPITGGTIAGLTSLRGNENNDIKNIYHTNGDLDPNGYFTSTLQSINHAIRMNWYDTKWELGNIRGNSTDSQGFGITFAENDDIPKLCMYIDSNGYTYGRFLNFSTDEMIIGKWIDGKPIYRKTFDFSYSASNDPITISKSLPNLDIIINAYGTYKDHISGLPYKNLLCAGTISGINWDSTIYYNINDSCLKIYIAGSAGGGNGYATIEYTKTTD